MTIIKIIISFLFVQCNQSDVELTNPVLKYECEEV